MLITVVILLILASILQLSGGAVLVRDYLDNKRRREELEESFQAAEEMAVQQAKDASKNPVFRLDPQAGLALAQTVGMVPHRKQQALTAFVQEQANISLRNLGWTIGLLVSGVAVGLVANLLAVLAL